MDKVIVNMFSEIPSPDIVQLLFQRHPELPPESWRQHEDVFISFHNPEKYVIETTNNIRQPKCTCVPSGMCHSHNLSGCPHPHYFDDNGKWTCDIRY